MKMIFSFFPGNKNLKQRNTISRQFFGHSTAITMIALSVLGGLLFSVIDREYSCFIRHSLCESSISIADHASLPAAALYSSFFSAPKNGHAFWSRRLVCESQTPFILSAAHACGYGTVHTVNITPAPYPVANPAIFVRAGPDNDLVISKYFIG